MALDRGRGAGITGFVDIVGVPTFWARIYRWSEQNTASPIVRTKRGDVWRRIRQTTPGATLALSGKIQQAGYPLPDNLKGATGTIVAQFNAAAKQTLSVMVTGATMSLSEASDDIWDIALTLEVIAQPTLAGFTGTQKAVNPNVAYDAAETHQGATKQIDPDTLADADTRRYDLDGLTDTDAAEVIAITALIATCAGTPSRAAMKVRSTSFERTDHWGGTLVVSFARTTTAEDIINQATVTTIDPNLLASQASTAAINATPPAPTGALFKSRGTTTSELNDGNILKKTEHGLRDTKDDVEMEGTNTTIDPFQLEAAGHVTVVTNSATPPATPAAPTAGAVFITSFFRQLVPGQYAHTFLYGPRTTADDAILPHTWTLADPGDLDSEGEICAIGSIPATPSPYYDRGVTGHYLTATKILYVKKFGRRSTTQDVEMEHTVSEGTPFEGLRTRTATVIDNGLSVDVIAALNYSTAVNFDGVSVKRLNDVKALLIKGIRDNPRIINFEMRSPGEEPVRGYVDGGDVYLYVRRKIQRANYWSFELAMQPLQVQRMRFLIRKRVTGGTIDMQWALTGKTNAAAILGLAAQSVAYRGIDGQHNYSNGGPAEIRYQCEYLSISINGAAKTGHIDYKKANMGWHDTTIDLSAINPGTWVKASLLGEFAAAFDSAPCGTADFSGLIT